MLPITGLSVRFAAFANEVLGNRLLPDREQAIVILATALSMEAGDAARRAFITAKQVGLSNEEIAHINEIVIVVRGQRIADLISAVDNRADEPSCCQ